MADLLSAIQLPVMPTASGASWPPRNSDMNPSLPTSSGYARAPGPPLFAPGGVPSIPPTPGDTVPPPSPRAPVPVTPGSTPTKAVNPYLDANGKIPAVAGPEAMAAFHASLGADPATTLQRAATANAPGPIDPLANQIRFVDQNSPRTLAAAGPAQRPALTNRDVDSLMGALPPHMTAAERASHGQLDIYEAQHAAAMEMARAVAAGDPEAQKTVQVKMDHLDPTKNKALATHLQNLRSISNTGFGTINAEQQATGQ